MKVTQPDSRSITIASQTGVRVHVPYRFFWNGHERPAESIILSRAPGSSRRASAPSRAAWEVRAFFLFGEIRDRLTEDASGVTLRRTWLVKTPGSVHLSIDLEREPGRDLRWLFPGVKAGTGLPSGTISFLGEKTSAPSAVFFAADGQGMLLFSRTSWSEGSAAAVGIGRTEFEDEPSRLRVEVRFPGIEEPSGRTGPRPEHVLPAQDQTIESPGAIERSHDLFMTFSAANAIMLDGPAAAVDRIVPRQPKKAKAAPSSSVDTDHLAQALSAALPALLLEDGGIAGIREHPGSPWLSSMAGLGISLGLRKLFPGNEALLETALRLADFSLKGQVPSGFFYEVFHAESRQWRGVRGQSGSVLLSLGQSARIAELLLLLAQDLADHDLPNEKYYLAGLRFVEFFLDEKARLSMPGSLHGPADRRPARDEPGALGGLELFFPMARVLEKTGKDRYRKALDMLVRRFSAIPWDPFGPPSSRSGRSADAAGSLLAARLFLEMRASGYRPSEPTTSSAAAARARAAESVRLIASLLLPWIRIHPAEDGEGALPGCLVDSFTCQRALCAGNETALLLLRLRAIAADEPLKKLLRDLARLCVEAARSAPPGLAFVQHTRWDANGKPEEGRGRRGPLDARRLASEVLAGVALSEQFPRF